MADSFIEVRTEWPYNEVAGSPRRKLCGIYEPWQEFASCWGPISKLIGECSPRPTLAAIQVTSVGPSHCCPSYR